jgi:mitogen-activated protein kinase kinase kinase ANP1
VNSFADMIFCAATIKWIKSELIGKGSFGRVYLAFNITTNEMLAVKQVELPKTVSDMEDQRQINIVNSLKGERETLAMLDHPNIVQYLGFEETEEFFSMYANVFLGYISHVLSHTGFFF